MGNERVGSGGPVCCLLHSSCIAYSCPPARLPRAQVERAIDLRNIMTSLGPAYIKLGQALSIRPDLLSPAAM